MGNASGPQMPLAAAGEDEVVRVVSVRGDAEMRQHLAELGFVEGSEIKVVSRNKGDVIVDVKGAKLALNASMASHIQVTL